MYLFSQCTFYLPSKFWSLSARRVGGAFAGFQLVYSFQFYLENTTQHERAWALLKRGAPSSPSAHAYPVTPRNKTTRALGSRLLVISLELHACKGISLSLVVVLPVLPVPFLEDASYPSLPPRRGPVLPPYGTQSPKSVMIVLVFVVAVVASEPSLASSSAAYS